jgi:hypothetical protein
MNVAIIDDPQWRTRVDPIADAAIVAILAEGGPPLINVSLAMLSNVPPAGAWPKALQDYVQSVPMPNNLDEQRLERAQGAFMAFGPLGVSILACASLPETYCLPGIAKLLAMSGQLTTHVGRRLEMTGQMLFDVMTPKSLLPGGVAFKAVLRTRLMHAALRYMLLNELQVARDTGDNVLRQSVLAWTDEFGQPINQMELVYTLMTFSHVVLRSAVALGIEPRPEAFEDYIYTWNVVGRLLGIEPELLPDSWAEAEQLFERIKSAHARESEQAVTLMADLEGYWVTQWPTPVQSFSAPAMHALCERLLTPATRQMLGITVPQSLKQSEVELLMKPAAVGLRLTQRIFEALPVTSHLAAAFIQHWATRRTAVPDGGLNDAHQHMVESWFRHDETHGPDV